MRRWQTYTAAAAVAVVLGLCAAVQSELIAFYANDHLRWRTALIDGIGYWLLWAILIFPLYRITLLFPPQTAKWKTVALFAALGLVFAPLMSLIYFLLLFVLLHKSPDMIVSHFLVPEFIRNYLYYGSAVAVSYGIRAYQRSAQLEAQLAKAQLQALQMQLHPHFLFNTLNSISALVRNDPEIADEMIQRLGDFLRITLEHASVTDLPLSEELEFVSCYLQIEEVRFSDRLKTSLDIAPDTRNVRVPKLILQPLVENAIRHGIANRPSAGRIDITARRVDGHLRIVVRDDGPGIPGPPKTGIGLGNTQERLKQLYGDAHRLALENSPDGGLAVTLEIPVDRHA
ncbi:MAG TPA: histidine kinase [Bryobacteraceae bacterium]|nr:histidine kinase [Bryobacteraceae bacterium]